MTLRKTLPLLTPAILLAGCVSSQDIEELHLQISDVQRQVLELRRQASSKEEVGALGERIASQTDALLKSEADVQVGLRDVSGQIDQLEANLADTNYRLAQLSQQIAATNQELRALRNVMGRSPLEGDAGDGGAAVSGPVSDPQTLYQTAYNDYLRGNYDLAILGFRQYLESFPDTELADNASYWIGECHYSQGHYDQAIREFDGISSRYPRSDKLASAFLKKGYAYLELGQRDRGLVQLQHVVRNYPSTDEANLARQRLRELGVDAG